MNWKGSGEGKLEEEAKSTEDQQAAGSAYTERCLEIPKQRISEPNMTSLLIWSLPVSRDRQQSKYKRLCVCVCVCVCMCVLYRVQACRGHVTYAWCWFTEQSWQPHERLSGTLLAVFPKVVSCCVTMEINYCLHWNALIIMESNPESYKLFRQTFLLFLLIQFSVIEPEKGEDPESLEVCGEKLM